jgi:ABC-2 type transport system ATP-binding protein
LDAAVRVDGLTKWYGAARGVDGLSFAVRQGEVFGFLGPNGAGKTTTIRILIDLLRASAGTAQIFGLDSHRDSVAVRRRTGNLPGDFAFDERATARELLELLADLRGLRGLGRAPELAERFQAELDRPLGQLSRGNRQKVGLIQAMFHTPELAIFDEPTTGLDPLMQEEFLALVAEERGAGRTVFLSSHDLSEVERACDRVALIREGRLVAVERVADLTARGFRHVHVEFATPVPPAVFASLPGVHGVAADSTALDFRVAGDLDRVVKEAARHHVVDLQVTHPTLEESFVAYYDVEERAA